MFPFFQRGMRVGTASVPAGHVVYAVGDVHGRLDLLEVALESFRSDFAASGALQGTVVLLGDLIDRGPFPFGAVRAAMDFSAPGMDLVPILGNHEEAFLRFLDDPQPKRVPWMGREAKATLAEIGVHPTEADLSDPLGLRARVVAAADPGLVDYMRSFKRVHQIGDMAFVHAGLDRKKSVERQEDRHLTWGFEDRPSGSYSSLVVHGHYATDKPEVSGSFVSIDTEAWKSGVLTTARFLGTDVRISSVSI